MTVFGICFGNCGKESVLIVNMKYKLCQMCNKARIAANNTNKKIQNKNSFTSIKKVSKRGYTNMLKDDALYERVWESRPHECEECGIFLGNELRNSDGKIFNKWRFSHILPKGRYPQFRHRDDNINLMCLEHHVMWEDGVQSLMLVYKKNATVIQTMMSELSNKKYEQE